jgi:hypothetical protein
VQLKFLQRFDIDVEDEDAEDEEEEPATLYSVVDATRRLTVAAIGENRDSCSI